MKKGILGLTIVALILSVAWTVVKRNAARRDLHLLVVKSISSDESNIRKILRENYDNQDPGAGEMLSMQQSLEAELRNRELELETLKSYRIDEESEERNAAIRLIQDENKLLWLRKKSLVLVRDQFLRTVEHCAIEEKQFTGTDQQRDGMLESSNEIFDLLNGVSGPFKTALEEAVSSEAAVIAFVGVARSKVIADYEGPIKKVNQMWYGITLSMEKWLKECNLVQAAPP